MNKKCKFKRYDGITLISLVITIIVLIILASVAIYLSLGNSGIFTKAQEAKEITNRQEATDIINLKITTAQMNKYAEKQEMPTLQELADILYEDDEIQYVALETQVGSKEKITVGEKTSIFTKLNQYPYEFEINGQLQLSAINGVKIGNNINNNNIYKLGTYESVAVSAGPDIINDMIRANTIEINVREKYKNYEKLTVNNFIATDSIDRGISYVIDRSAMCIEMYSTKILEYDSNTGILTILKGGGCYDNGYDSYDYCITGTVTIYIIENTEIPEL